MGGDTFKYGKAVRNRKFWYAARISQYFLTRLGKPEVLTAMTLLTKDLWSFFVPFNATSRFPDGTPCRKPVFWHWFFGLNVALGGVEPFQRDYAFTSWAGSELGSTISYFTFINVESENPSSCAQRRCRWRVGVLRKRSPYYFYGMQYWWYVIKWLQQGLTSHGTTFQRRDLTDSPQPA